MAFDISSQISYQRRRRRRLKFFFYHFIISKTFTQVVVGWKKRK